MPAAHTITGTVDEKIGAEAEAGSDDPGLVLIFSGERLRCDVIALRRGDVVIGREPDEGVVVLPDERVSRRHVEVGLSGGKLRVLDLGSRNGTFVGGKQVQEGVFAAPCVLRAGNSLFLFVSGIGLHLGGVEQVGGAVVGGVLRAVRRKIARAGAAGEAVLLTGPSGAGKELAARLFHESTGRKGPFVAINCATIPPNLAERLLFGARRGAYSGANTDAEGLVAAADGGTLFLDEVADLDLGVQAKLLRVLETREVIELGAVRPRHVDIRLCAATLKDLRAEVEARRFREDLYFRIGRPEVTIPALAERREEIPWLAATTLSRVHPKLVASAPFLQECLLRPWPGNVRELLTEVAQAGRNALDEERFVLAPKDLSPGAGQPVTPGGGVRSAGALSREEALGALRRTGGNVTAAARELGLHRNQLRRWLAREGRGPAGAAGDPGPAGEAAATQGDPGERSSTIPP